HKLQAQTVTFSNDGRLLATGSIDQTVRLWDAGTGALVRTMNGHTGGVVQVAFSRHGKTVASASTDGTIRLWDVEAGETKTTFRPNDAKFATHLAFSPDGTILAAGLNTGVIQLWRAATAEQVRKATE